MAFYHLCPNPRPHNFFFLKKKKFGFISEEKKKQPENFINGTMKIILARNPFSFSPKNCTAQTCPHITKICIQLTLYWGDAERLCMQCGSRRNSSSYIWWQLFMCWLLPYHQPFLFIGHLETCFSTIPMPFLCYQGLDSGTWQLFLCLFIRWEIPNTIHSTLQILELWHHDTLRYKH